MYLLDYVKEFGKYTFKEKPINNVDALIFATLVYSNIEACAPSLYDTVSSPVALHSISKNDFEIMTAKNVVLPINKKLISLMMISQRYKNILLKHYLKSFDASQGHQFFAATFDIPEVGIFIAFRGTDKTVAGWKEDLETSLSKTLDSQLLALQYLDEVADMTTGPIYVGGHSKGGHATLYSTVYCNNKVKERIVKAFDFDGNGLNSNDYYNLPGYLSIKDRIVFIKPFDSMVGELLYNPKTFLVVKSKGHGFGQHVPYYWKIDENTGDFIYTRHNSKNALIIHWTTKEWLKTHSIEDKNLLFDFVIETLGGTNAIINYVLLPYEIGYLLLKSRNLFTKEEKKRLKVLMKEVLDCYKTAKKRYKIDGDKKQEEYTSEQ